MGRFNRGGSLTQTPQGGRGRGFRGGSGGGRGFRGGSGGSGGSAPSRFNRGGGGGQMGRQQFGGTPRGNFRGGRGEFRGGRGGFRGGRQFDNPQRNGHANGGPNNFEQNGKPNFDKKAVKSMPSNDSDEDEELSGEEEEEEESVENKPVKGKQQSATEKKVVKSAPKKGSDEDEEDDDDDDDDMDDEEGMSDEDMSDEDEEEASAEKKPVKEKPAASDKKTAKIASKKESDDDDDDEDEEDNDDDDVDDEEGMSDEETDEDEEEDSVEEKPVKEKQTKQPAPETPPAKNEQLIQPKKLATSEVASKKEQVKKDAQKPQAKKEDAKKRTTSETSQGAPDAKRAKPDTVPSVPADKKVITEEQERKSQQDKCTLFIKNLPKKMSDADIKGLSSDIMFVRRKGANSRFAWLIFNNEQACDKNYKTLNGSQVGGCKVIVDFCGQKSSNPISPKEPTDNTTINPLELYIGNIPGGVSVEILKSHFPLACSFTLPKSSKREPKHFAFVRFESAQEARAAFDKSKSLKIGDSIVNVSYARAKK